MAEATPDAADVSDTELARRIVEEEQARLGMTDERLTATEHLGPEQAAGVADV
ncbi:hypothetical protein [Actinacidiphila yeochonensis]|uniref:hypothetical protein n=1 Tax=Actinacidiphila yeochonensis TaxID=89050 RepID=UPI0018E2E48B|nr:hypothetical protein [Actinacidiphila yeochonensis]